MKIAIVGFSNSFRFDQIGGMDALARRSGVELLKGGHEMHFLSFCAQKESSSCEGIHTESFENFELFLNALRDGFQHVLMVYIPLKLRLKWWLFQKKETQITFHQIFSSYSESFLKRCPLYLEHTFFGVNGKQICLSPRLTKWSPRPKHSLTLLPPVPDNFFLQPKDKKDGEKIRLTFMGRLDPGKGIFRAIEFFKYIIERKENVEVKICGYPWKHKGETVDAMKLLTEQDEIPFEITDFQKYSSEIDENVRRILSQTDILFLPYTKLSSTIDTPLVMLEGMAHLCAIITPPFGDMPEIYGRKDTMPKDMSDNEKLLKIVKNLGKEIHRERERIYSRCLELAFGTKQIAEKMQREIFINSDKKSATR